MKPESTLGPGKNALEWTVFALSCLLLTGMAVVLVKEVAGWENNPARLEARLGQTTSERGQLYVPVEIINRGDQVAENVALEVHRQSASGEQRAVITFDFVPRDATRRGRVSFRQSEELPGTLAIEVISHEDP